MIFVVAIVLLLAALFLLRITGTGSDKIDKAFAGAPKTGATVIEQKRGNNKTIFTENGVTLDFSSKRRFVITGKSLEKVGMMDGTVVYTDKEFEAEDCASLIGLFIVLRIDNDRTLKEHPEITQRIEGYKARLVVSVFPTRMDRDEFIDKMKPMLEKDSDVVDVSECLIHLWKKYDFASHYYNDDSCIVVSITYKDGDVKDYSFHSMRFLEGIVRYRNSKSS